ncbi:Polynucleotidyl transferase- ribonuclease H-like superfamily protein [Striga hermonthica]|uniref:Polynucleotidyl transferase- ribonuclease H-like superfamily protein n=1 Tax=Striga hermonthica TaxID=68872 RepID=A0A9N7RR69_STRHE|nr:Polynucleotidyl transferase- ribonuclease H-like superfamily protein [Striga hermonthica]
MYMNRGNGIGKGSRPGCSHRTSSVSSRFSLLKHGLDTIGCFGTGHLTIRSAYTSLTLVVLAIERLLTNDERHRRHLVDSPLCELGRSHPESILNVLRDSDVLCQFWKKLVPRSSWGVFFGMELDKWLETNLSNQLNILDESWDFTFGVNLWRLWHRRNNFIFNGTAPLVDGAMGLAKVLVLVAAIGPPPYLRDSPPSNGGWTR